MNVLIIEDEPTVSEAVAHIMRRFADKVECVSLLSAAMKAVREFVFDLILLDLRLPDSKSQNSLLCIRSFKLIAPKCAVVVITGAAIERSDVMKYGADGFIEKNANSWQEIIPEIISAFRNTGREDYEVFVRLMSKVANDKGNSHTEAL